MKRNAGAQGTQAVSLHLELHYLVLTLPGHFIKVISECVPVLQLIDIKDKYMFH